MDEAAGLSLISDLLSDPVFYIAVGAFVLSILYIWWNERKANRISPK